MKKVYNNMDIQVICLEEQDILTYSLMGSNENVAEDGAAFNELFPTIWNA